ncbi:hypothetical protein AVEN_23594-1 [Araneus ventricosus]|uniref:Transcriptional coactivator p15 (PC4) C-terminal domain-containing protein n=1 Tax=Araneus ventricosus TaxID=182803 RepID=A0A4Y2VP93_ARAVE|nr:hypothetical protein AVEN_23594-1 [Araneus ventricosus]
MKRSAQTQNVRGVKDSSFSPDAVPENHLGNFKYVLVTDFANAVRIHIREYKLDGSGRTFTNPTLIELRQEISQYHWLRRAVTSFSALARSVRQS